MARITIPCAKANLPTIGPATRTYGPIFDFTPPIDADFSWVNQGSATITDMGGSLALNDPAGASDSIRLRVKSAPSTPYTIDIAFLATSIQVNTLVCGFAWRQSSDGKLVLPSYVCNAGTGFSNYSVNNYTNETTYSSTPASLNLASTAGVFFLRAVDDGANRSAHFSADGQTWVGFYSIGRTNFMTANQVGFFADSVNATYPMIMTLLSWKQS